MADHESTSNRPDKATTGSTITNNGPWEAVVDAQVTGNRLGQLSVTIPDWKGSQNSGIIVSYASPFYGTTYGTDTQQLPDGPYTAGQSYGMWMVPPDIGSKVLVMFVNGERNRGYWFACIYDSNSHHMVPALARDISGTSKTLVGDGAVSIGNNSNAPVVEYSTKSNTAFATDGITTTPRQPHEYQYSVYLNQGLYADKIRGAISSSSLREAPSNVYGISTPGRKVTKSNQVSSNPQAVIARTGGHQFVMDDGATGDSVNPAGTDQLIRLRTSGGHQILMNDTEHVLYIASDSGNQWMEFGADGMINVYGRVGLNMRTEGVMNLHADGAIVMQSPVIEMNASPTGNPGNTAGVSASDTGIFLSTTGNFSIKSLLTASIGTDGLLDLSGKAVASISSGGLMKMSAVGAVTIDGSILGLNTLLPIANILPVFPAKTGSHQDTTLSNNIWTPVPGVLQSICTVVPAHEPWTNTNDFKTRPSPVTPPQANFLGF